MCYFLYHLNEQNTQKHHKENIGLNKITTKKTPTFTRGQVQHKMTRILIYQKQKCHTQSIWGKKNYIIHKFYPPFIND